MSERGLLTYSRACAWSLARSHARSGDPQGDSPPTWARATAFDKALARFSTTYADLNELDYRRLKDAQKLGEIPVEEGV